MIFVVLFKGLAFFFFFFLLLLAHLAVEIFFFGVGGLMGLMSLGFCHGDSAYMSR